MKKTFAISLLIAITALVQAQVQDKKANAIMKEVTDLTRSYKSIQIAFDYLMENKTAGINETFSGTLLMQGDRYRVDVGGQHILSDGKTLWTYNKDAGEVQIHDAGDAMDAMVPSKLLTTYSDEFRAKLIREDKEGGRKIWIIDMNPTSTKSFHKVRLHIDQMRKQVTSLSIHEKNGTTFTYRIKDFKTNLNLDPAAFVFNKKDYPGADIIDMR